MSSAGHGQKLTYYFLKFNFFDCFKKDLLAPASDLSTPDIDNELFTYLVAISDFIIATIFFLSGCNAGPGGNSSTGRK